VVFHNVLGARTVAALLDYVTAREADFSPAKVRDRGVSGAKIDGRRRDCLLLGQLGEFKAPVETFVRKVTPEVFERLGLIEPNAEPREFEISAHGKGGHFVAHLDTLDRLDQVRIVSCVHHFAITPHRFSGGELRATADRLSSFANRSAMRCFSAARNWNISGRHLRWAKGRRRCCCTTLSRIFPACRSD
jgi:hypothetical protein